AVISSTGRLDSRGDYVRSARRQLHAKSPGAIRLACGIAVHERHPARTGDRVPNAVGVAAERSVASVRRQLREHVGSADDTEALQVLRRDGLRARGVVFATTDRARDEDSVPTLHYRLRPAVHQNQAAYASDGSRSDLFGSLVTDRDARNGL